MKHSVAKLHRLNPRERVQVIAALRLYGRFLENAIRRGEVLPHKHPLVRDRFNGVLPLTLNELETLIGKLDRSFKGHGIRLWEPNRWL